MNTHKSFGFAAAVLVTVAQAAVFATDTSSVNRKADVDAGYEQTLDARVAPASQAGAASDAALVG